MLVMAGLLATDSLASCLHSPCIKYLCLLPILQTSAENSATVKRSKQKGKTQEDYYFQNDQNYSPGIQKLMQDFTMSNCCWWVLQDRNHDPT